MANTCYSAVVVKDRRAFMNILDYVESDSKFKDFMSEKNIDYMGGAVWCGEYILRFETRWDPNHWIARYIAREFPDYEFEFWWQETWTGTAGMASYANGKSGGAKKIKCDITSLDMQHCLDYTDWEGIKWTLNFGNDYAAVIACDLSSPAFLKVEVRHFNEQGDIEEILRVYYVWRDELADCLREIKEKYSPVAA